MFLGLLLPYSSGRLFFLQVGCLRRASGLLLGGCRPFLHGLIFCRAVTGLLGRAAAFRQGRASNSLVCGCLSFVQIDVVQGRWSGPNSVGGRAPTPSAVGPRPRRRSGPDRVAGRAPTPSPVGPRPCRRSGPDPVAGRAMTPSAVAPFNGSILLVVCSCRRVFAASFCLGPVTGPG